MNDLVNLFNQAISCHQSGRIPEAINLYLRILPTQRENDELLFTIGTAYCQIGQLDEGLNYLRKSSRINPKNFHTFGNMGRLLTDLRRFDEAVINYNKALVLNPNFPEALLGRGNALVEMQNYQEAILDYDKTLSLVPDFALAHSNKGRALLELERLEDALIEYEKATAIDPNFAEAFSNWGNALKDLERFGEAIIKYNRAIELNPNLEGVYYNRGIALYELNQLDDSLVSYNNAIALKPDYAEAYGNRGVVLQELKRLDEALADYRTALQFKSDIKFLLGTTLHTKMFLCDWEDFESNCENLKNKVHDSVTASQPFAFHGLIDSAELQNKCAQTYIADKYPLRSNPSPPIPQNNRQKIKIGYFSTDFGDHPVTHLLAGLFKEHDRSKFEVIAFSLEEHELDAWRNRVIDGVDRFIDASNKSDSEIAALSRSLEIDIAIDLNGHTKLARTGIFSHRAAPVQTSYIGFLGTMGATYYDYLFADPILIPEKSREFYTEKIAYLPSYQCNDDQFEVSDKIFTRKEFGLPDDAFVFCSFNNNWKITPQVFDSWMRILDQVSGSVLWIYVDNVTTQNNLQNEAKNRGIDPNRLIFASRIPLEEHLARQRLADLFLDTFPYNAGATASNALRVGLPVITRSGETFASRYGASLLNAVGMSELVTESAEEFESLAVNLASHSERLATIKDKLANNVKRYPLFDTSRFARSLESAFVEMNQRLQNGLPPVHIFVSN